MITWQNRRSLSYQSEQKIDTNDYPLFRALADYSIHILPKLFMTMSKTQFLTQIRENGRIISIPLVLPLANHRCINSMYLLDGIACSLPHRSVSTRLLSIGDGAQIPYGRLVVLCSSIYFFTSSDEIKFHSGKNAMTGWPDYPSTLPTLQSFIDKPVGQKRINDYLILFRPQLRRFG